MHDTVLFHALNLRALNSYLAVIRPLYHHAVDPVDGPVSGNNAFLLSAQWLYSGTTCRRRPQQALYSIFVVWFGG